VTCATNDKFVIHSDGVQARLKETGTALLRANAASNFTEEDLETVAIYRSLKRFKRAGFPTNVIYPADPSLRPILLPEILTPNVMLHALDLAAGSDPKLASN
jgi:thiol:disulfide interchange protein